jgi:hypothetical protein
MKGFRQPPGRRPKHVVAAMKKARAEEKRTRRLARNAARVLIETLRELVDQRLDEMAQTRPPAIPPGVIRLMWVNKGGGDLFAGYAAAVKERSGGK